MKTRTLLITIVLLTVVMVVIAGGSTKKLSMDEAYDILAGTWMNEEYNELGEKYYMFIIQPDGTYIAFTTVSSSAAITGELTILDTMIDSDGTIWIKAKNRSVAEGTIYYSYEIQKYSNSNMTVERADSEKEGWYGEGFPTDLEPLDHVTDRYRIYYRQQ